MSEAFHHPGQEEGESAKRGSRRVTASTMSLNLTPMIDVVFQLLIYFIVTSNFVLDEGLLTAQLPERGQGAAADPDPDKRPLEIYVSSFGAADPLGYSLEVRGFGRPQNFTTLAAMLVELQKGTYTAESPVLIRADDQVRWQHVVNAVNAATTLAKYKSVGFAGED